VKVGMDVEDDVEYEEENGYGRHVFPVDDEQFSSGL
jgi:hypothetical protein